MHTLSTRTQKQPVHQTTLHSPCLQMREASVEQAVQQALDAAGRIDVVVHNAGVGYGIGTYAETVTTDQFMRSFDVNLFGIHRLTRAVLPTMRQQEQGLLLMISSTMGRIVIPFAAAYTAAKYAVEGLAESYRYELAPSGIDVAVIEPGGFATPFWTNLHAPEDASRLAEYGEHQELPGTLYAGIGQALQGDNAPDPQLVADAVYQVIMLPAGQRPLRTVVDPLMGGAAPAAINHIAEQTQVQLFQSLGIESLLAVMAPV